MYNGHFTSSVIKKCHHINRFSFNKPLQRFRFRIVCVVSYRCNRFCHVQVSTIPSVVELMQGWDIKETNRLIEEFEKRQEQLHTEDLARKEAEIEMLVAAGI